MLRLLNVVLVCGVIGVAVWLYQLKYGARDTVAEIAALESAIAQAQQDIILLKAEWSHVTRPDRIQVLARRHLELEGVQPSQIIKEHAISTSIPMREEPEPVYPGDDPIASLLQLDR